MTNEQTSISEYQSGWESMQIQSVNGTSITPNKYLPNKTKTDELNTYFTTFQDQT